MEKGEKSEPPPYTLSPEAQIQDIIQKNIVIKKLKVTNFVTEV